MQAWLPLVSPFLPQNPRPDPPTHTTHAAQLLREHLPWPGLADPSTHPRNLPSPGHPLPITSLLTLRHSLQFEVVSYIYLLAVPECMVHEAKASPSHWP